MAKNVLNWVWCPLLITVLAVLGYVYQLPIEVVVPVLVVILAVGIVTAVIRAKSSELEISAVRLRQLSEYFNRRFMGNSSLSIFAIIDSLFSVDNPKLWDWARACGMSQRIFDTWSNNFISRVQGDFRARNFAVYLHTYLGELWSMTSHYYEFVEQFCEVAEKIEIPHETIDQYGRFVIEYNAFAQNFRDNITELRKVTRTEIEPPSVKFARDLSVVR